ncbi:MAG: phosphogluconate dehydrogenase (NADP(+)-dependent, decarboxylating) [Chlamydiae bacterium CG10_big_fil_rev_8_21_14_0_10_42_34]|nr:MAG: phosphogluconate dehydrogenase (NADP(+)-dependent, decarboxylating) [Chlamydiae bacterium CG10_big_fil_rev_8_21_14_0_10_42_34]
MMQADIGLIGLAVMGQNLVLNMADHGYTVAVFNRTASKTDEFLKGPAAGKKISGSHELKDFVASLKRPRKVMLMVKAGAPVDEFIDHLVPLLEAGDIIIDGGNSHFPDSQRRFEALKAKGILFIGAGISGGEEGARHGPSIMPGGNPDAWPHIKEIFQSIAAKSEDNEPCCDWVGEGGAGHYVKMVHNGIEYGDMQLICEAYDLLKHGSNVDLAKTFTEWNKGALDSYLIEITAQIFGKKDTDGKLLLDKILDVAGQKGTGKWTGIDALDRGMPLTLIGEAVFARCLSSLKTERQEASKHYSGPKHNFGASSDEISQALYASKIISYAQGFMLMRTASEENKWKLNFGSIALMWRGGCIIRSKFLGKIKVAYDKNPALASLLVDPFFVDEVTKCIPSWRKVVAEGALTGVPLPCFSTALSFFDGYRSANLPANLLQAQRDFFGAHTYERVDQPRGKFFHTNWTGKGGDVSSSTYNV